MDENAIKRAAISEQGVDAANQAKREALKNTMRNAALGATTAPNVRVNNDGYAAKVRTCIRPRVASSVPPRHGSNPTVQYRTILGRTGLVESVEVRRSSGEYPSYIDGNYLMYDY